MQARQAIRRFRQLQPGAFKQPDWHEILISTWYVCVNDDRGNDESKHQFEKPADKIVRTIGTLKNDRMSPVFFHTTYDRQANAAMKYATR